MKFRVTAISFLAGAVLLSAAVSRTFGQTPAATADKTLIPTAAWSCYMPEGIPKPEEGTLVLEAEMQLDNVYDVGLTPYGQRQVVVTQTGKMNGPKIQANILAGGLDFELTLANGVVEVEQILVLRTSDNRYAIMRNAGTGANANDVRVVYDFEAPTNGDFAWLNTGKYVGRRTIDAVKKTMKISIYDVTKVEAKTDAGSSLKISKPEGVPAQPWDYRKPAPGEKQGEAIVTESVQLGGSQGVQNGKRGGRNIIPITGGVLTGTITGKVLFGGADYQSQGGGPAIDARYLWQATEGDIIIVRNTGPFNALVPIFETKKDGKYAWINSGTYLSSPPGGGGGGRGGPGAGAPGGLGRGAGGPGAPGGAPGAGGPGRGAFGGAPGAGGPGGPGPGRGAFGGAPGAGPASAPGTGPAGVAGAARGGPGAGPAAGPGGAGRGGPGGGMGGLSITIYKSSQ